ncbi:amidohydrolase [Fusibacter paucivorans]|uniref:Amidohydrolase n=1 Tax=Fusibacter paucivorans TaxID=76009 RepID=A0ABS5PK49_9FIRM|nr:amidohydrolase [Fusibacter paucivorans]MBS7525371.1 amidohydrolase [Fusibacter paucivorans]
MSALKSYFDKTAERWYEVSDRIWSFSELKFDEYQSAKLLADELAQVGFEIELGIAGIPTAFKASYGKGEPVIAILAEYDALSGMSQCADVDYPLKRHGTENGHGCGHHLLGTASAAAAAAIKDYMMQHETLKGSVIVYGCPGEEGGSGKAFMARAGVFQAVDAALTWHPGTHNGVFSAFSLANYQVYFRFEGVSAHAAASPHLGRSALDAVELMNIGVNYLREHMISEARIHYAVTNTGGFSPNVVQSEAEVLYLIRAPKLSEVEALYQRVCDVASGAALMTGTKVTVVFDKACSDYMPNVTLGQVISDKMLAIGAPQFSKEDELTAESIRKTLSQADIETDMAQAKQMMGALSDVMMPSYQKKCLADCVIPYDVSPQRLSGSTDVGDVSQLVPTAQCFAACASIGTPMHTWQMVSQGKSGIAHKGMRYAAEVLAAAVVELLEHPEKIEEAKAEHLKSLNGNSYQSPIPADVMPKIIAKNGMLSNK